MAAPGVPRRANPYEGHARGHVFVSDAWGDTSGSTANLAGLAGNDNAEEGGTDGAGADDGPSLPEPSEDNLVSLALRWWVGYKRRYSKRKRWFSSRLKRHKVDKEATSTLKNKDGKPSSLPRHEPGEPTEAYLAKIKDLVERRGIETPRAEVRFSDVRFTVQDREDPTQERVLLHKCSGTFAPASMVALMGPSGCGKTTLLDCIARKKTAPYEGEVTVNGEVLSDKDFRRITAYVPQGDYGHALSTVREELEFVTRMKNRYYGMLGTRQEGEVMRQRDIGAVLDAVGLSKVADSYVGGALVRGISGGQRRRLTLCKGVVSDPTIMFMDEPTSGLSASDSERVVQACRLMVDSFNISIIMVIHQPKASTFRLFDTLLLMAEGRVAYFGPREGASEHFEHALGVSMPVGVNPADYYLDMLTEGVEGADPDALTALYEEKQAEVQNEENANGGDTAEERPDAEISPRDDRDSEEGGDTNGGAEHEVDKEDGEAGEEAAADAAASPPPLRPFSEIIAEQKAALRALPRSQRQPQGALFQTRMLLSREFRLLRRNWAELVVVVSNGLFLGFLIGALFLGIRGKTGEDGFATDFVQFQVSFLYISITTGALLSFANLPVLINDRVVYLNEHEEGLYSVVPYMFAKFVVRSLVGQTGVFIFAITSFMMAGFDASTFPFFWLALGVAYFSLDAIMAWLATMSASHEVANTLASAVLTIVFLFNGFTANSTSSPDWIIWIQYLSSAYYAFIAIATEVFENFSGYPWDCFQEREQEAFPELCLDEVTGEVIPNGIKNIYNINDALKWWAIGIMALFTVVFNFIALLNQRFLVKLDK